ncbi:MAG: metalloprotease PmbA [Gammaproteobacteria bacterium RIFCSPHIGHO2_12_FULL_41_20]|nr:MAG: metalloprotease PmbA [Gammaproteobacteria bacterium RIFCSPHIGHO2_12_FULL_41_20]
MKDTQSNLKTIALTILQEASRLGASQAEVILHGSKGFSVTARQGDVETVEYNQDKSIEITVYLGKRCGSASLSDTRPEAIRAAVEAAHHIARFTDEDPYSGLAEPNELAFDCPEIDLFYPWSITVEQAIQLACDCEAKALAQDKRIINTEGVNIVTAEGSYVYANSLGFLGTYLATRHEISCVLIAKQQEQMQRDYSYTVACDSQLLDSIDIVAKQAAERTVRRLGAHRLSTRKAPVIFAAEEARSLLGHFVAAIQGGNLYRKSSFLLDHLNKPVFAPHIQIHEEPLLPKGLGSAPFDSDGVRTRPNIFIKDGILHNYALGTYSARKLNRMTTGNADGVHNLIVSTGEKTLSELLKTMHTGLLVTEMMGNGVNLVTGDYSRGVSGYWIENGEIQYPVQEITIAGKLQNIYGPRLVEIGTDIDTRGNIRTGSILIEEMIIAGD